MRTVALFITLLLGIGAAYAQEPDLGTEAQRTAGRDLYMQKCAQCHGEAGDGQGVAAPYFNPLPRDLTTGIYKVRTSASGELPTHDDMVSIIRRGMPYTGMPAWPGLSRAELNNLAYFLKTFSPDFSGPYGVVEPIAIPRAPSFSSDAALRGREVYMENQCYDCHGNRGRGDGDSAPTLETSAGDHIRPADLTKRWTFIGGSSRPDIYRTFTTGMDGSPMPSFDMSPEDRWALVDYIYSLSRDQPNYASLVIAKAVTEDLDLNQGPELFQEARAAYFPVVGQVIEPGRAFFPGIDAVEVRAVYNEDEIAIMLVWHDMTAERTGTNDPALPVVEEEEEMPGGSFSDAVAIQIPARALTGRALPYFLFGDATEPVHLWFADLAGDEASLMIGRGSQNIERAEGAIEFSAGYEEGAWTAIFKRSRTVEEGIPFEEQSFVPIAFSLWDGFNNERGNKRGVTSWYQLYLEPAEAQHAAIPMAQYGFLVLLLELGLIYAVRRKYKTAPVLEVHGS